MKRITPLLVALILLSACSSSQTVTPTPLPDELVNQILQTYRALVLIQVNAELLDETASRVQSGELVDSEETDVILALAGLIQGVEEALPQITPPDVLIPAWQDAVGVHEETRGIVRRWRDQEISSLQVIDDMAPVVTEIGAVVRSVEAALASEYNLDLELLAEQRQEIIARVPEIFETGLAPSPTPAPPGAPQATSTLAPLGTPATNTPAPPSAPATNTPAPPGTPATNTPAPPDTPQATNTPAPPDTPQATSAP